MKTLTDFRKTVETGVDPRLYLAVILFNLILKEGTKHRALLPVESRIIPD